MTTNRPENGRFRSTWPARVLIGCAAYWLATQTGSSAQEACAVLALIGMTPAPPAATSPGPAEPQAGRG